MPVQREVKHNGVWQPPDSNGLQKMKSMWPCSHGSLDRPLSDPHQYNYWSRGKTLAQTNWLKLPERTNARFDWRRKRSRFKAIRHQDKSFRIHASWVRRLQKIVHDAFLFQTCWLCFEINPPGAWPGVQAVKLWQNGGLSTNKTLCVWRIQLCEGLVVVKMMLYSMSDCVYKMDNCTVYLICISQKDFYLRLKHRCAI